MTEDPKELLLSLVASLTLCDHMGDVSNDMTDVLRRLGITINDEDDDGSDWGGLLKTLQKLGVRYLHGGLIELDEDEE